MSENNNPISITKNCDGAQLPEGYLSYNNTALIDDKELYKKFQSTDSTTTETFCTDDDIQNIIDDTITNDNFIRKGSSASVFKLPPNFVKEDQKQYVLRLTNGIGYSEYEGLYIQGHLAKLCPYINPVKQIGTFQTNKTIEIKDSIRNKTFQIPHEGIYAILEKGNIDLELYIENETGRKSIHDVKKILHQLLEGVQCIHENGFVHLDLKPSNIIFNSIIENIQIIDFGFTTRIGGNASYIYGTKGYKIQTLPNRNRNLHINVQIHHDFKSISSIIMGVTEYKYKGLIHLLPDDTNIEHIEQLKEIAARFDNHPEPTTDSTLINDVIKDLTEIEGGSRKQRKQKQKQKKIKNTKRKKSKKKITRKRLRRTRTS